MWVSRRKFTELADRLRKLEERLNERDHFTTVYDEAAIAAWRNSYASLPYYGHIAQRRVSYAEAMHAVLGHLGLKLQYVAGKPESVKLTEEPKL